MARTKITAYVTPDIADTLQRVAIIEDRSQSDLVEDAIVRRFAGAVREAEHAALMARLDGLMRRLSSLESAQERQFEFLAQSVRFFLSMAPGIPAEDHATLSARGAERLHNLLSVVTSRLGSGRSVLRETGIEQAIGPADRTQQGGPVR